jgi:phosphoribosylformylglycinamidine cyclo-ligase
MTGENASDERDTERGDEREEEEESSQEELTYAAAGVDIDASEAATAALVGAASGSGEPGKTDREGSGNDTGEEYAGLIDLGGTYLGLATDGVGTKLLVAEALGDFSTIGIDCIAMNANDLVAAGVEPVAFVDYLAVAEPEEAVAAAVGEGLRAGAEKASVELLGGETAVMPEVVRNLDLAGTCAGFASEEGLFPGEAAVGDALVGFRSTGIHSNGLTLARQAVTREHDYGDPFPGTPEREGRTERTIGEALLEPTRIYTGLLEPLRDHGTHAAAHVTGGGWGNLTRMGGHRYTINDAFDPQPVFGFVREQGSVSDEEMYSTFNMGTGFVAALPPEDAEALCAETDGRVIGRVEEGSGVAVGGVVIE